MAGKITRPVSPVYLVAGNDEYNKEKKIKEVVKKTMPAENRDLNYLDQDCAGQKDFIFDFDSAVNTVPFLADKRVVVLRNFENLAKELKKELQEYVEDPAEYTVLILVTKDVKKTDFLDIAQYKNLCKIITPDTYYRLYAKDLAAEVRKKFTQLGKSISDEACDIMVERVGSNMRDLDSEIEKIGLYIGQKKNIEESDVLFLVSGVDVKSVFDLINAITGKNLLRALKLLNEIFYADGYAGPLVVGAVYSHFKKVWMTRALLREGLSAGDAMAHRLGVSPYFVGDFIIEAKKMDEKTLSRYFKALAIADDEAKGGAGSGKLPVQIMEKMVYSMLEK